MRLAWVLLLAVVVEVGSAEARRRPPAVRAAAAHARQLVQRGRRFQAIAERRLPGQHIVYRDRQVTAFLDQKDPQSPVHDPDLFDWELDAYPDLRRLPPERRAHLLVIPNRKREHVGPNLSSGLRGSDLSAALAIVRKAEGLANELGISRARVFINPVNKISVGYLHVHVVGERDPDRPYPHIADQ